jgi:diguanylate cyclase (GGDEF)-like protein
MNQFVHDRWVTQATRTARTVVLISLVAIAIFALVLAIERVIFHADIERSVNAVREATKLADNILIEDERLTNSAMLGAATGDPKWAVRYEKYIPVMDAAIDAATKMSPPGAAERFDQATRVANDALVAIEREAFARAREGKLEVAQKLLASSDYARHKETLAKGTYAFIREIETAVEARLHDSSRRSWITVGFIAALATFGFVLLWLRVNRYLQIAEQAFLRKEEEVNRLALQDPLTGLANRRSFHLQLDSAIARARREQGALVLLMIDLDDFKIINDRLGHAAGDRALVEVGLRIRGQVREDEIAARFGGDEFVVVLNRGASGNEWRVGAQRIMGALCKPMVVNNQEVNIGASAGAAFYPADAADSDHLIHNADVALYRSKADADHRIHMFDSSANDALRVQARS